MLKRVEDALVKVREREETIISKFSEMGNIGELNNKITELMTSVNYISQMVDDLKSDMNKVNRDIQQQENMKIEMEAIKRQNKMLKDKINDIENYSRRENIEITGIQETKDESVKDVCEKLFKQKLKISEDLEVVRCHRLGKSDNSDNTSRRQNATGRQNEQQGRPILVRFKYYADKEKVLKKRSQLKGTGIFLNDDLSFESKRKKQNLVPILKRLREIDNKAHFRGDRIYYKGRLYGENNLHDLPVDAHNTSTISQDGVTIFSGKHSKLSNLHQCTLKMDGRNWHSVEQYVQYNKAKTVGDQEKAAMILATDDSQDAMHLGKSINTEQSAWSDKMEQVVEAALRVKFSEPAYKLALQRTEDIIGESTQHKMWGTGLSMGRREAYNPRQWTGKNLMGKLLSKVKREICSE
jgi:ribA/ribD-fused uncharacterized protein